MSRIGMVLMAAAAAALSVVALAADKPAAATRAAVLQAIVSCRAMTDTAARLACYDSAAAKLDEAEASGQVVVIDREQARRVRKEVFGLQLPSLDIFSAANGKGAKALAPEDDVDRITATVTKAWHGPDGHWMVQLDTGAVWRQFDAEDLAIDPHTGSKAVIKKGALGSFFLGLDGQSSFKAQRER